MGKQIWGENLKITTAGLRWLRLVMWRLGPCFLCTLRGPGSSYHIVGRGSTGSCISLCIFIIYYSKWHFVNHEKLLRVETFVPLGREGGRSVEILNLVTMTLLWKLYIDSHLLLDFSDLWNQLGRSAFLCQGRQTILQETHPIKSTPDKLRSLHPWSLDWNHLFLCMVFSRDVICEISEIVNIQSWFLCQNCVDDRGYFYHIYIQCKT